MSTWFRAGPEFTLYRTKLDQDRFAKGKADIPVGSMLTVVGHFDDEAAATCGLDGEPEAQSRLGIVLTCRTTFVDTDLISDMSP